MTTMDEMYPEQRPTTTEAELYPEHTRLQAVVKESQACGDFLEWLKNQRGVTLMRWEATNDSEPCWKGRSFPLGPEESHEGCKKCNGTGVIDRTDHAWVRYPPSTERLLADYFQIDLDKIEQEKQRMLEALRGLP